MLIKIIMGLGLLALGIVFSIIGMRSRPHGLKKELVRIVFAKGLPRELAEPLAVLRASKSELVGTVIWTIVFIGTIVLLAHGYGKILYTVLSLFGTAYTLYLSCRRLLLYDNAIVLQTLLGHKVYYLDDLDWIESYNIINSFNRGVSYGYRLRQHQAVLVSFPKGSFKELDLIESVYRHSPYAEFFFD